MLSFLFLLIILPRLFFLCSTDLHFKNCSQVQSCFSLRTFQEATTTRTTTTAATTTASTSTGASPASPTPTVVGRISNSKLDALFQKMTPLLDVSEKMDEVPFSFFALVFRSFALQTKTKQIKQLQVQRWEPIIEFVVRS